MVVHPCNAATGASSAVPERVLQLRLLTRVMAVATTTTASALHPHPYLGGL